MELKQNQQPTPRQKPQLFFSQAFLAKYNTLKYTQFLDLGSLQNIYKMDSLHFSWLVFQLPFCCTGGVGAVWENITNMKTPLRGSEITFSCLNL